jgi:hypothetical protein
MQTKDLASEIRQEAEEEVRQKNLVSALYFLTSKENPYSVDGLVASCHKTALKVYFRGNLVFSCDGGKLKRYICGKDDWTIALINEFNCLKNEQKENEVNRQIQEAKNKAAKEKYITCQ